MQSETAPTCSMPKRRPRHEDRGAAEEDAPATEPVVVVVDPLPQRRYRVTAALRGAGCAPIEATTPLEVIAILEQPRGAVAAVVVAATIRTQTRTEELVAFLADAYPRLCLALIVDRSREDRRHARAAVALLPGDDHHHLRGAATALRARLS
jgi:hypothetical protein